jgi:hypothetical protein
VSACMAHSTTVPNVTGGSPLHLLSREPHRTAVHMPCVQCRKVCCHTAAAILLLLDDAPRVVALEGRLQHALSDNLHSLQDSFQSNPFLHRMSDGVHSVQHALSDNLHSIQGQLQSVQGSLQHAGHAFTHGLHAVESRMQSSAANLGSNLAGRASGLQQALRDQLRPIVQWPTPRWPVSHSLGSYAGMSCSQTYWDMDQQLKGRRPCCMAAAMFTSAWCRPLLEWHSDVAAVLLLLLCCCHCCSATPATVAPQVFVYFVGACVCLLTSGVCHLLGCCQRHIAEMVWRFDYAGIAVLIVTSFVPAMYYAFLCQPFWRNFYLLTTISMGESPSAALLCFCTYSTSLSLYTQHSHVPVHAQHGPVHVHAACLCACTCSTAA